MKVESKENKALVFTKKSSKKDMEIEGLAAKIVSKENSTLGKNSTKKTKNGSLKESSAQKNVLTTSNYDNIKA